MAFIGSNSSDYSWAPTSIARPPADPNAGMAWTSNGNVPVTSSTRSEAKYAVVSANGKFFSVPVVECPPGGCANGTPVAWASTSPDDQRTLVAYTVALDQDAKRAAAYGAGPLGMAGGAALGGIPVASQFITGAGIGAWVNAATQYQLNGGDVNGSEVAMGAFTGGMTMGCALIPTVLINTGGSMVTSAYENQSIGASMAGAAAGSVVGWKIGNWTERAIGQVIQRATTGFTDAWVSQPFAISAPAPVSTWPAVWGATFGAGTQEVVGDFVKNKLKEQP